MSAPNTRRRSLLAGLFAAPALAAAPAVALASTVSPPESAEAPEVLAIGERLPDFVARVEAARSRLNDAKAAFERLKPSVPPEIVAPEGESMSVTGYERGLRNEPIKHDGAGGGGFRDIYCSMKLEAFISTHKISGRTKEGRRIRHLARVAAKFEADRQSAIEASGYDEAFGALLSLTIELQDNFARVALATKPRNAQGLGIYATIIAIGNGPASYDGRAVGYCDALGLHMAESFIALTADGRVHGNAP